MASIRPVAGLGVATLGVGLMLLGCSDREGEPIPGQEVTALGIEVTSAAFTEGSRIPVKYTCEGGNTSPPLSWTGVPAGTRSIALIADDPDTPGGTWVHWVYYGIPPNVAELPEGVPTKETLPDKSRQGTSDFESVGYGGPCPPPGRGVHRYYSKVYALDTEVDLGPGATKKDLLARIEGSVLAEGRLIGTYERK